MNCPGRNALQLLFAGPVGRAGGVSASIRIAGQNERGPEMRGCVGMIVVVTGKDRGGDVGRLAGLGTFGSVNAAGELGDQGQHLGAVQLPQPGFGLAQGLGLGQGR